MVDPGTYEYEPGEWAYYFRRTRAHATVTIDGQDQSHLWGFTRWVDLPAWRVHARGSGPDLLWIDAEHGGYARLPQIVYHRRRLAFIMPDIVVVEDLLTGQGDHTIEQTFPLHPMWDCRIDADGAAALSASGGGPGVFIRPLLFPGERAAEAPKGQREPLIWGFHAANYGVCEPSHVVVFRARAPVPARLLTVLAPAAEWQRADERRWRFRTPEGTAWSVVAGAENGFAVERGDGAGATRVLSLGMPEGKRGR